MSPYVVFSYLMALWNTLIFPCVTIPSNWKYCFNDWDGWLYPEIQRGWEIYQNPYSIYQEERDKLDK